jgi:hypothetical protein
MDEKLAREILGETVRPDDRLLGFENYAHWHPGDAVATLDGEFTADELEAVAWWMRNKAPV